MFPAPVRWSIVAVLVVVGVWDLLTPSWSAVLPLAAATIMALGHWRYSTVWFAWRAFRRDDFDKVQELLARVPSYSHLTPQCRSTYDWMMGAVMLHQGSLAQARHYLERAVAGNVRTANNRSIIHLLLSRTALQQGNLELASEHLAAAAKLPHRAPVDDVIEGMAAAIDSVRPN